MNRHRRAGRAVMRHRVASVSAAATGGVGFLLVLRRMREELLGAGRLSPVTVAAMYGGYAAHAVATVVALTRGAQQIRVPSPVVVVGGTAAAAGMALCVVGMGRFVGPGQVSGSDPGSFVASGVYRVSRNPQYLGYLAALAGLAVARRSATALALAGLAAGIYRWWVPVEERHLAVTFGQDYASYSDRTPRWLGWPRTPTVGG